MRSDKTQLRCDEKKRRSREWICGDADEHHRSARTLGSCKGRQVDVIADSAAVLTAAGSIECPPFCKGTDHVVKRPNRRMLMRNVVDFIRNRIGLGEIVLADVPRLDCGS